jgi:hypothetical protein
MSALSHATARLCRSPASAALAHLSTAAGMSRWTLGLWNCREIEPGLLTGVSLFDGSTGWVRVRPAAEHGVDYHVGASADQLVLRIHARVVAGEPLGYGDQTCLVTLLAWRPAGMADERWQRLIHTHETEMDLIQGQLDSGQLNTGQPDGPDPARPRPQPR